jgi:hypothetical protein
MVVVVGRAVSGSLVDDLEEFFGLEQRKSTLGS